MAISNMQQPRQMYGLGSFVKKIGKGIKGAVKSVAKIAKSPLGIAALGLGINQFGIPFTGGKGAGFLSNLPGVGSLMSKFGDLGPSAKIGLGSAFATYLGSKGFQQEEVESITRDKDKLSIYLKDYFTKLNPNASDEEIEQFVITNTSEYAVGGRVGLEAGANKDFQEYLKGREEFNKKQNAEQLYKEYLENKRRQKVAEQKTMAANGGLMPMGIMRTNKAGTIERDYRETGGFVPVGIKEKADDVPAMLSKNEFVMTADAVRGIGDGNIEKGAQRLYDQMKQAEKRVV
jgi:hypothetical protein